MPIITRTNSTGMKYHIQALDEDTCEIIHTESNKRIVVHYPLNDINQAWFNWQIGDHYIQNAFNFLTPGEREFLLTGLLEEEFDSLFKEQE